MESKAKFDTLCIHAGHSPDKETLSRTVPIYQTSAYQFEDSAHAADLFSLKRPGNIYTRIMNPTVDILERRVTALEGGVGAVSFSSGMSAIVAAITSLAGKGDEVVSASNLYGGTVTLFSHTLKKFGINVVFRNGKKPADFKDAITSKTKAIFAETIGNPELNVLDIMALSTIAHDANIPLIVDSTVTTPYLLNPFRFGADIVVHSLTKYLSGHGTVIGGIVVDGGKFNWDSGRFPQFVEPDPSYHGVKFVEEFQEKAFIVRLRVSTLRDMGACLGPFDAFLVLLGIETLPLRMQRHSENAFKIAEHLHSHPKVAWVNYPRLRTSPSLILADKYLPKGASGLVGFGVKGGYDAGKKFIDNLNLLSHVANIGDAKTLVIHPASTTHQQLDKDKKLMAGVTDDFIRLSVGLEDVEDIIKDIDSALDKT